MEPIKKFLSNFGFPLILVAFASLLFLTRGDETLGYLILSASVLTGIILERVIPYRLEWNQVDESTKSDFVFFLLQPLIAPLAGFLTTVFFAHIAMNDYLKVSEKLPMPFVIQVLLGLFLSGIIPYWLHRIAHETNGFLWRVHSIHHSPKRLYWMNAFRSHPINTIWNSAGAIFPSLLFGFSSEAILMIGLLNNFFSLYNHMNIAFKLGFLNYIFNMNEIHRWHHSKNPLEGDHNYSSGVLVIWDQIFKSFYYPKREIAPSEIGLYSPDTFPNRSNAKQFLYPICKCT